MPSKWRDIASDLPDWKETGDVEVRRADGTTEVGEIWAEDVGFNGEDEYPILALEINGKQADLWSFKEWRRV